MIVIRKADNESVILGTFGEDAIIIGLRLFAETKLTEKIDKELQDEAKRILKHLGATWKEERPPFHDEPKTWTELENERMEKRGIR
jgi:hypothetical protein